MTSAPLYCLCQQPYDVNHFMIECDLCQDWFHGSCVGVDERKAAGIDIYHCPACEVVHGPSIMKKCHRSSKKHRALKKQPVKTGSRIFIHQLQGKTFDSPDEVILKPKGNQLTVEFLEKNSFSKPILILKKDGLGMTLPPTSFTVRDVEQHVGSDKEIDVIDVARQASCKMMLGDFVKYYYSKKRGKIFNVTNLEFSNTRLSNIVEMPKIVQKLSWIENLWPGECGFERPNIQKYCLMSVQDSYTDFHIEFGGTSVWYHVLKGEKIFYLIHPTDANLTLFECWSNSSRQKEMFFGDQVDKCYKCPVKQGQTLFIPTGWIHAVLTPVDCLAFGGNFLHSLNIEMQLKAYETGRQLTTPAFFKFPSFETICWHVGQHILDILGGLRENGRSPASYLVCGGKALSLAFRAWTRKEVLPDHEDEIPKTVQPTQLMEDLDREIHLVEDIFQQNIQKPSTILGLPMFFHTNSSPLSRPTHSASLSKPTLAVPSKSRSKKKGPKHRDIFKKTEQKGRESPALGPDGCHGDNLMDVNNPPALKLGSCQNVVFNITTACLNGSDDASESNKVFDESEYPVSPLKANRSTKKTKKSLSNSWRAKIMKKKGNSRMVEGQVIGGNSDLKSNKELLVEKRLNKEEMSLVVSPKLFPNVPCVEFCSDENQIIERREAEITTQDNHKIDEEMVEGVEGKHSNGSGSDRNFDPLKARKRVGGPGCVVFTEDPDSSSNKKATQDSVLVANLHSSPPSPAPSTSQALLSGEQGQGNESSSSALGTVSKSPVSQRPPRKWPIKRLKYWRPKGKGDSASGGGSGSGFEDSECIYIILESDDEYDEPVLKPPPKKRKISDDAPWTPRACVTPTLPKQDHPAHESTGVASAEIGLAATAAKLAYQNKAINGEDKT